MPRQRPASLEIVVDTREQKPLPFPATITWDGSLVHVHAVRGKLDAGDYCLKGFSHLCLAERKGSITEVWSNLCTADARRQHLAFERLRTTALCPVLILDFPWSQTVSPSAIPQHQPGQSPEALAGVAWELLIRAAATYNLTLLALGGQPSVSARIHLGGILATLFLAHYMRST